MSSKFSIKLNLHLFYLFHLKSELYLDTAHDSSKINCKKLTRYLHFLETDISHFSKQLPISIEKSLVALSNLDIYSSLVQISYFKDYYLYAGCAKIKMAFRNVNHLTAVLFSNNTPNIFNLLQICHLQDKH